ncbi:MAG: protease complex subunit PrcB family protein, partial [Chloroflexi bacterium]|nr:protease complex subunit PrcB family protein [Chloroflexota bacterium]
FLSGGGAFGGGCGGPGGELPFRTLADSQAWALQKDQPAYFVVTEKNWRDYYPALPAGADLTNNVYVVAFWGARPNPGYRISMLALRQLAGLVQVAVDFQEPDPGRFYPQVIVYPVAVAEVSKKTLSGGKTIFQFLNRNGSELGRVEVEM